MTHYVALLRGVAPTNPNMRNVSLRDACEHVGLRNVRTVVSSGNVVFEDDSMTPDALEALLEAAWEDRLEFTSTTMVRSREQIEQLVERAPFGRLEHGARTYLLATFSKRPLEIDFPLPHRPEGAAYSVVDATPGELFTVTDTTGAATPDVMRWLEQRFGKDITSRTWRTVLRILRKMSS